MSKKQKRILLPVLLLAVVASIGIRFVWARTAAGRSRLLEVPRLSPPVTEATAGRQTASIAGQQNLLPQVEVELITIRPTGFEPKEITRPPGRFLLGVDNKSGLDEVALRLNRDIGSNLRLQRLPKRRRSWREMVDLIPGDYLLSEANHPEWVCHIKITAR